MVNFFIMLHSYNGTTRGGECDQRYIMRIIAVSSRHVETRQSGANQSRQLDSPQNFLFGRVWNSSSDTQFLQESVNLIISGY